MGVGTICEPAELRRILAKFTVGDGCWEWTGSKGDKGYGKVRFRGRTWRAHLAVYAVLVGDQPPDLEADHTCRNRACVRPGHLEWVTHAENMRRARGNPGFAHRREVTHCVGGHERTPENIYVRKDTGHWMCRICVREGQRRRRAERRAAA